MKKEHISQGQKRLCEKIITTLKLKIQYFGHLMQRADSLGKTLVVGKIEGRSRRRQQRMRWLHGISNNSMNMSLSKLHEWWWTGKSNMLQSMGSQRVKHERVSEVNWTEYLSAGFSDAQTVKIHLQCKRPRFNHWVRKIPWRGNGYPLLYSSLENSMRSMGLQSQTHWATNTFTSLFIISFTRFDWFQ